MQVPDHELSAISFRLIAPQEWGIEGAERLIGGANGGFRLALPSLQWIPGGFETCLYAFDQRSSGEHMVRPYAATMRQIRPRGLQSGGVP